MIGKYLTASIALAALAACSSPREREVARQSNAAVRTLERIGSIGDPGRVAAADIAFARQARDEGQWTAFLAYAAPGAVLHGEGGIIPAAEWIATQENPETSVAWTPNTIWSSCDGTLAVSFGRFQEPSGQVGSYVTVWELQNDRSYKYTYDMGGLDNPQPAPPEPDEDIPEGAVIVPGMTAINGMVADCPQRGADAAEPGARAAVFDVDESANAHSRDGTLGVRWHHRDNGERSVQVHWIRNGEVATALDFTVPPASAE